MQYFKKKTKRYGIGLFAQSRSDHRRGYLHAHTVFYHSSCLSVGMLKRVWGRGGAFVREKIQFFQLSSDQNKEFSHGDIT